LVRSAAVEERSVLASDSSQVIIVDDEHV